MQIRAEEISQKIEQLIGSRGDEDFPTDEEKERKPETDAPKKA